MVLGMRRAITSVVLAVVAVVGAAGPVEAQIQASELAASDVVVGPGVSLPAGDREQLEGAARGLRARGTPTKFAVVANRPENPPMTARELRRSIAFNGNVLLLSQSPRSLGIASSQPEAVIQDAFDSALGGLRADPIGGTIAVAEKLAAASSCGRASPGGGRAGCPTR